LVPGKYIALGKGALKAYEARQEGLAVRAGSGGHFALPSEESATGVVAVHDDGFAYVLLEKLKSSPQIQLQPWGRIEGTLRIGQRLGTNELVVLESGNTFFDDSHLILDAQDFQARTDDQGRFLITFVPPGERRIARLIPSGSGWRQHSAPSSVMVQPGTVTRVVVGGTGRDVIGKIRVTGQPVNWENVHASLHTQLPDSFKQNRTVEEQRKWSASPEAKQAMKNYRVYPIMVSADGSFRAEEVLPGKYQFDLSVMSGSWPAKGPSDILGHFQQDVVVPEPAVKEDPTPANLGTLESKLEPVERTASSGQ